jgi:uncharacterized membrane protein
MKTFTVLLVLHIFCGAVSLLTGLLVMLGKKGNHQHRVVGKVYFYSMFTAAAAAIPMSYIHPNYFLFLISVFTIYMLLSGVRYLYKKKDKKITLFDWTLTFLMLLFAISFIFSGIRNIINQNYFGVVFIVFGTIGVLFSYQDFINFKGTSKIKNYFLTTHLQRMCGSYIASTTAFLVVNNKVLPYIIAWLLPTICLAPLIVSWTRKYKLEKKDA